MEVTKAIILKTVHYSETQKIIRVYSREKGYLSLIMPSNILKRKNYPVHLMQMTEIEYLENSKGDLHKLSTAAPVVNLPHLYFDIFKMNIILLWGEILHLLLRNEGRNENLFDFIAQSVEYLNSTQTDVGNFNLFFLYRLSGFVGFQVNHSSWQEGYVFNVYDGSFYPADGHTPSVSGPHTAEIIHRLCSCQLEEVKDIQLNRQARNILLEVILLFYTTHLNVDFNIKSIQVIREVFS